MNGLRAATALLTLSLAACGGGDAVTDLTSSATETAEGRLLSEFSPVAAEVSFYPNGYGGGTRFMHPGVGFRDGEEYRLVGGGGRCILFSLRRVEGVWHLTCTVKGGVTTTSTQLEFDGKFSGMEDIDFHDAVTPDARNARLITGDAPVFFEIPQGKRFFRGVYNTEQAGARAFDVSLNLNHPDQPPGFFTVTRNHSSANDCVWSGTMSPAAHDTYYVEAFAGCDQTRTPSLGVAFKTNLRIVISTDASRNTNGKHLQLVVDSEFVE